jgi:hypothetical protein
VGRDYAGVLGLLAFATELSRGLVRSADVNTTLRQATIMMFVFAAVGGIVGAMAARIVAESVRANAEAEAARQMETKKAA